MEADSAVRNNATAAPVRAGVRAGHQAVVAEVEGLFLPSRLCAKPYVVSSRCSSASSSGVASCRRALLLNSTNRAFTCSAC
jgi:hypothetical protein